MGALTLGVMLFAAMGQAQVVEPFDIRYQTQQNGGIVFLANSTMYCGGSNNCTQTCLLYTSPSPRDRLLSRMPSSA